MKINKRVYLQMKCNVLIGTILAAVCCITIVPTAYGQNNLPVREYTNPDEVVTFDRTTTFVRAIDVINDFAQKYANKIIIDRTKTGGDLGISIPPMQWRDALDLILKAKYLQLVEKENYFEIVKAKTKEAIRQQGNTSLPDTALSTDSKEVRINAIFFDGSRRALQEIGVDWSTLTQNVPGNISSFVNPGQGGSSGGSSGGGGGSGGSQGQLPDVQNFDGPFVSVNSKGAQSVSQNVFNSIINFGNVFGSGISVQALFSAFQADNLGEILASPSIRVLDGKEGRVQVGQDFSIKQRDFAGNVTDKFFSVGTILKVTPHIIAKNDTTFIHLDISAQKSSAQPDPVSTVINKQQATTQALLLNHEATVIAGLYRTESTEVRRGIPILKDLPPWFFGLRYLFGYNSKDYQTRELVILIQASIVPDIPQRMNKKYLPGKFKVLEKERQRMQGEIKEYKNYIKNRDMLREKEKEMKKSDNDDQQMPASQQYDSTIVNDNEIAERQDPVGNLNYNTNEENSVPDASQSIAENNADFSYYAVGGAFKDKNNAVALKQRMKQQGYTTRILVNQDNGFYMVAYKGFNDKDNALRFVRNIRKDKKVGAWIYEN